jgi:hypothetical protein
MADKFPGTYYPVAIDGVIRKMSLSKALIAAIAASITANGTESPSQDISGKVDKVNGKSLVDDTKIAQIHASGSDNQDLSGKVDKESGKALLSTTEAAKIHSPGSDNQDLSHLITDQDARLTDTRTPKTHTHANDHAPGSDNQDLSNLEPKNSNIQVHISSTHAPATAVTLATVKADSEISDAISKKHSNTNDHAPNSDNQDLSNLVVKVTGKQLSTEDYTTAEKTKLTGLSNYVAPAFNSPYRTLLDSSGSHIATKVAGTYGMGQGDPLAVTGTGTLYPLNTIYIAAADYPTIDGKAAKLRIRAIIECNDVAPFTGTFTIGLHPVTRPATSGGTGLCIYTIGAAVAGSTAVGTNLAADSQNGLVGSDFALPADGFYVLAVVTNGTMATSSHVHISASLQTHNN